MAIFKKLNIGDTVATSGTRVFKKLITDSSLPIWNGTDLKNTIWVIQGGWTAEAGYGEFDVSCRTGDNAFNAGWGDPVYEQFCIGYYFSDAITSYATADRLCWRRMGMLIGFSDTTAEKPISFIGGTDTTNPRLIDWLLQHAKLVSHQLVINGTYLFNDTITELPIVYAEGADLYEQTAVRIFFDDGTGAFVGKTMFTEQIEDGYGKVLRCGATLRPQYYFDTNLWDMECYRSAAFRNQTAQNLKGEDVTAIFYKWLIANATKQGQITFTIDGITYTADEGMCWRQWVASAYDTDGIITPLTPDCVKKGDYFVTADGVQVKKADIITAGYNYVLVDSQ